MQKNEKENTIRLRGLVVICSIITLVLIVATYAWFIGMRTVDVSSFDIEIASTDTLLLSLNGRTWDTTVSISKETYNHDDPLKGTVYPGHTNNWGGKGLIPMSSIGEVDPTVSRMKLFEKASITATYGGFRLMTSRVDNYSPGKPEQDGYVVFDLFIKNASGTYYNKELNELDEEAIYLTDDSEVTVSVDGIENTGIENSVRVAFAQIGRVSSAISDPEVITSITCNPDSQGKPSVTGEVTGICRDATIWEPNDTKHVQNAINWYNATCRSRVSADLNKSTAYDGLCNPIVNGQAYPTYAVGKTISSSDKVDVYDGPEFNGYVNGVLTPYHYFTDTDKLLEGYQRPTFMTLAPNSITKIRVYIWIEGQDIDNYEFAAIGKKISVNFGFTKQKYGEGDVDYEGPDITPPIIKLNGRSTVIINVGDTYEDEGATAIDNVDGDLTDQIVVESNVNTSEAGIYTVTYNVTDSFGNKAIKVIRTVIVK